MLILSIFVIVLSIISSQEIEEGFCKKKGETCGAQTIKNKYMFYTVNRPEGFNLRRDVYMRFAIMFAEAKKHNSNWYLVLPPWHNLYHWKSEIRSESLPWRSFFDVNSLKKFAPVVEYDELLQIIKPESVILDRIYVLQNYEDAFEDGVFTEKWEISHECRLDTREYAEFTRTGKPKETVCVKFQGKISKLWEIVNLHPNDRFVMFVHGEIPLHDHYGTKTFWDCRKSMKFNDQLFKTAKTYISKHFECENKCNSYLSVHWRRQDFARSRKSDVPSIKGAAKQINGVIKNNKFDIKKIFIATDAAQFEFEELEKELKRLGYDVYSYTPTKKELEEFKDGGVAIIDQIICSHAKFFIGSHESTFTFRIQEEREILGLDSSTTFNRLCPDTGKCERPSKWTIVQ